MEGKMIGKQVMIADKWDAVIGVVLGGKGRLIAVIVVVLGGGAE
jgi:hypothetical protein